MTVSTVEDAREQRVRLLDRVENRLDGLLAHERERWAYVDPRAAAPIGDIAALVSAGGKRLRPTFCLLGHLAAGGSPTSSLIVDCAAGLELIHVGALIHDDVLDAAETRRGAPTAHVRRIREHNDNGWKGEARRYGEGTAILAGDLADILADRLTAGLPVQARPVWNELLTEIIIGQHLDVAVAAESLVDPEISRWIAVCKSGRYSIHRPLLLGAAVTGREDLAPAFEAYGEALGEAFQLRDDLIDAFGDSDVAGKPVGLDLEQHKMTLLLSLAAEQDPEVRSLIEKPRWDLPRLQDRLESTGVGQVVEERIDHLVDSAVGALQGAGLGAPWRSELTALAHEVAYRSR
ncbi:geranylgeranyl pyrophosphate synthase [Nocardiopsis kunsanensis]|uniref:Geranylgeranyl pyrophosphate synthase n=1 Tax=Nocardiopsis kunsanensis TaxID=141693 RepID=A0A918X8R6_9ACTN|nr:polyprenyl synthetase family protein [Nocardiopsis kunsanensis]GHD17689.1 geranylgeranyl pyrophosphate synthase [Nocardiopsis kunsanensis]